MAKFPKGKPGVALLDDMQKDDRVTLDRFYDRNPWKGGKTAQDSYIRQVVYRNRRERAAFMQKEQNK